MEYEEKRNVLSETCSATKDVRANYRRFIMAKQVQNWKICGWKEVTLCSKTPTSNVRANSKQELPHCLVTKIVLYVYEPQTLKYRVQAVQCEAREGDCVNV